MSIMREEDKSDEGSASDGDSASASRERSAPKGSGPRYEILGPGFRPNHEEAWLARHDSVKDSCDRRITDVRRSFYRYDSRRKRYLVNRPVLTARLEWHTPEVAVFEPFSKLPCELRERIWTYALPEPRTVVLHRVDETEAEEDIDLRITVLGDQDYSFGRHCTGITLACRESKAVFDDHYVSMSVNGYSFHGMSALWGEYTHEPSDIGYMLGVHLAEAKIDRKRDQLIIYLQDLTAMANCYSWLNLNGVRHVVLQYDTIALTIELYRNLIEENPQLVSFGLLLDRDFELKPGRYDQPYELDCLSLFKIDDSLYNIVPGEIFGEGRRPFQLLEKTMDDVDKAYTCLREACEKSNIQWPRKIICETYTLAATEYNECLTSYNRVWLARRNPPCHIGPIAITSPYYRQKRLESGYRVQLPDFRLTFRCRSDGSFVLYDDILENIRDLF